MVKKNRGKKQYSKIIIGIAALIIIIVAVLIFMKISNDNDELEKMYATFKVCPSCIQTLNTNDEFATLGKKTALKEIQKEGFSGQEFFIEGVKLFGIANIADPKLRETTYFDLQENLPESRAIMELSEDSVDFGNVSESETSFVMKEFTIKNAGTEDLYIYEVGTSCSCLNTKIVDEEKESPSMGRFSYPYGMSVKIEPGETKRLRVTYDARVNSFFRGPETRFVYIHTNDLVNFVKQISIDVVHVD